jgi:hypothetical protein
MMTSSIRLMAQENHKSSQLGIPNLIRRDTP